MTDIFQIASIGMLDGRQRLEAVSQNAASNGLAGYRRHVVAGSPFDDLLRPSAAATSAASPSAPVDTTEGSSVNLQPGAKTYTGRALDVAIDSDDQFFALTDGTRTWLTRSGAFRLNDDGVLVGEGGLRVVGTQGDVHLAGIDVTVGADGRIAKQGETVASLQLFRVDAPTSLRAAQGSLLTAPGGMKPAEDGRVRGGMLEASNTDSAHEILDAMSVSRQFEAMSRVVQSYDGVLGEAIEKLGGI